jgi:hypothetical protein
VGGRKGEGGRGRREEGEMEGGGREEREGGGREGGREGGMEASGWRRAVWFRHTYISINWHNFGISGATPP